MRDLQRSWLSGALWKTSQVGKEAGEPRLEDERDQENKRGLSDEEYRQYRKHGPTYRYVLLIHSNLTFQPNFNRDHEERNTRT
ncbi:hypothetical protein BT96DRAFT_912786 [Gymnopus androsaceus JB14]|uniref:Uncharacterized protein n=1 Tax=Gymnopus androsaceus JB14 TaxID=1447944 RepID=A0A6A4IGR9_9AGAR|nr:hypothetical protein BT96DRAFT_912786 [Gymnopus androsaceus JB14]